MAHLLLVDDEAALRSVTAERLTERGYEVVEADSGEQALDRLEYGDGGRGRLGP